MNEFISLSPSGLPEEFDAEVFSEKPVVTVVEGSDKIEIKFVFPGFTIGDNEQQVDDQTLAFKEVGISGAGFVSESGKPLLPSFGRFVQIPPGCDIKVSTKKNKPVKFENIIITPAQEQATDQSDSSDQFEYNVKAYKKDSLYPSRVVEISKPQQLDDYMVLLVHVRPLQYNPAKQQLIGYSNIKITIKLSAKEEGETDEEDMAASAMMDPTASREGFGNLLLNPGRRINERLPVGPIPGPIVPKPRGPEFLIIYDNKLKEAAKRLEKWKNRKGLITEIVTIDTVGNSVKKIKKYIRNRRKFLFSRLRYVLLLGDVGSIPTEEQGNNTTDYYYFTSKDPSGTNDCLIPWVSGGRIPVNSLGEANSVVNQIINYERNPPCDADYYMRMTFAAYFQDDWPQDGRADRAYMKTMEGIRNHMVSLGIEVERVYVSNNPSPQFFKDGTVVPEAVRNAIVDGDDATDMLISETTEGQMLIGHRDHGNEAGWAHPSFKKEHLDFIMGAYPSIFYSINCLTGRFDNDPNDSFAESLLELNGGAPSLIAATELSGTWRNDSMMKGLFDALWPGVISTYPSSTVSYAIKHNRLGDILNYAKSYLLVAHGSNAGVKSHYEMYHVVGDPTLQLWSEQPASIKLRAKVHRHSLKLHIKPAPAEGVVTIWHHGKLVKRMATSSARISIPLRELRLIRSGRLPVRRFLEVCVAAPGYRYSQTRVRL